MQKDIEEVAFTEQAEEMLNVVVDEVRQLVRLRAEREAFTTRGEPVEVTASDVQRVYEELMFEEREYLAKRGTRTRLLLGITGLTMGFAGVLMAYSEELLGIKLDISPVLPATLIGYGLTTLFVGVFVDRIFNARRERGSNEP